MKKKTHKICPDCKLNKPVNEFYKSSTVYKKDGLKTYCKVCDRRHSRESYTGHRDDGKLYLPPTGIAEDGKIYSSTLCEICDKLIYQKSPNHVRCLDCAKLTHSVRASLRRSIAFHKQKSLEKKELGKVLRRFVLATNCVYCGREFSKGLIKSIDHVIPLTLGGNTDLDNIIICCLQCNKSKQDFLFKDWLEFCVTVCKHNGIIN